MKITPHTKISALIEADERAIEALASASKPFKRLKNPILRKVMAPRVTIAEAAKMGGCTVETIISALKPLGFEYEQDKPRRENDDEPVPAWIFSSPEENIINLDVRGIIESGTDPLKEILGAFKEVPPGKILCVINTFVPTPLIHLLKQQKAEDAYVRTISENEFHTYFLKKEGKDQAPAGSPGTEKKPADEPFDEILRRFAPGKIREIDVRDLEMPLPMQTILTALGTLPPDHVLYVHHKRVPVYLLDELSGKGFEVHLHTVDEHNVKMILFKSA